MTASRRTVLAVPGSSDRFIEKARTLPVDALFLDLEDAVAPSAKAEARKRIVAALLDDRGFAAPTITYRVNGWASPWTTLDVVEVVSRAGQFVDAIVLPKVAEASHVQALDLVLRQVEAEVGLPVGRIGIEAQIEDAQGLLNVASIAAASPRLVSLVYGPGDFMASVSMASTNVGSQPSGYPADAFHHVLMSILVAARAYGLQAIDGPFVAIRDEAGFRASAAASAALGYDGKWVLHPSQIAAGNEIFSPAAAEVARARKIVTAYQAAKGAAVGAIVVDNEMVDEAGIKVALAILARVGG